MYATSFYGTSLLACFVLICHIRTFLIIFLKFAAHVLLPSIAAESLQEWLNNFEEFVDQMD